MPSRLHLRASLALLTVGASLFTAAGARPGGIQAPRTSGAIFHIIYRAGNVDYLDPALSYHPEGWALLDTTCARLMNYPDKPPPEGYRAVPEVANGFPRVSADGKTYTFTLKRGFRFSDGAPVRASAFARAIERTLA